MAPVAAAEGFDMASYSGFDSFGSFMRGMSAGQAQQDRKRQLQREEEDRAHMMSEREYHAQRRGVLDQRQDTQWEQQQEDRADDRSWQSYLRQNQRDDRDYALQRRPIEARQKDEAHALNMRSAEQGMRIRAAQEGRAAQHDRIKMQMAEMGLDEARLQREHRDFVAKIGAPARRFALTGNTQEISAVFRELTGGNGELVKQPDGTYVIESDGQEPVPVGGRDDVINALSVYSQRPEAYLSLRYELEAQKAKSAGTRPTTLMQNTEYLRTLLPQGEDESTGDYNARLLDAANRARSRDPESEFRSLVARIMERQELSPSGKVDQNAAVAEARQIMGTRLNGGGPASNAGLDDGAGPFTEGERITGPDGKKYVVRNGEAVRVY